MPTLTFSQVLEVLVVEVVSDRSLGEVLLVLGRSLSEEVLVVEV